MKKHLPWLIALLMTNAGFAQTLKIFHKSHSGMAASFEVSLMDHFGWSMEHQFIYDQRELMKLNGYLRIEPLPTPPLIPVPDFKGPVPQLQQSPATETQVKEKQKPAPAPKPAGSPAEGGGLNEGQHMLEVPCPEDKAAMAQPKPTEPGSRLPWGMMGMVAIPVLVVASGAMRRRDRSAGEAQKNV